MTKHWLALEHGNDVDDVPGYLRGVFTTREVALKAIGYNKHVKQGADIEGEDNPKSNVAISYDYEIVAQVIQIKVDKKVEIDV